MIMEERQKYFKVQLHRYEFWTAQFRMCVPLRVHMFVFHCLFIDFFTFTIL